MCRSMRLRLGYPESTGWTDRIRVKRAGRHSHCFLIAVNRESQGTGYQYTYASTHLITVLGGNPREPWNFMVDLAISSRTCLKLTAGY